MQRIFQSEFLSYNVGDFNKSVFTVESVSRNIDIALIIFRFWKRWSIYPSCFSAGDFFGCSNIFLNSELLPPLEAGASWINEVAPLVTPYFLSHKRYFPQSLRQALLFEQRYYRQNILVVNARFIPPPIAAGVFSREEVKIHMRLGRFERPTYCLGGSCSILLSYNRFLAVYHATVIKSIKLKIVMRILRYRFFDS